MEIRRKIRLIVLTFQIQKLNQTDEYENLDCNICFSIMSSYGELLNKRKLLDISFPRYYKITQN